MSRLNDAELLRESAWSRDAMAELVRRHLPFVYGCAVRQVNGDSHLAEDVTQAVFILLGRKAPTLRRGLVLRDWLFVTTRYAAKNALKMEARRRYHERHAAAQRPDRIPDPSHSRDDLAPLLDEAIARLGATDRAGVLLSFFDNMTFPQVGASMGVSEEAARKRVARAVAKMRSFFASRGVLTEASTGAIVASVLQAHAAVVPVGLMQSVISAALGSAVGSVGSSSGVSYAIAKGASQMFMLAKLKVAATAVIACTAIGASGTAIIATAWATQDKAPITNSSQPAQGLASGVARFDDGVVVEILGVTQNPTDGKGWWRPDGTPTEVVCEPPDSVDDPPHNRAVCLRVTGVPEDADAVWIVPTKGGWSSTPARNGGVPIEGAEVMSFSTDQPTIDVRCRVANGPWETAFEHQGVGDTSATTNDWGSIAIAPGYEQDGQTRITASYNIEDAQVRMTVMDKNDVEHFGIAPGTAGTKAFTQMTVGFNLPIDQVDRVVIRARKYDHIAEFKNVTMDPSKRTQVEVKLTTDK